MGAELLPYPPTSVLTAHSHVKNITLSQKTTAVAKQKTPAELHSPGTVTEQRPAKPNERLPPGRHKAPFAVPRNSYIRPELFRNDV